MARTFQVTDGNLTVNLINPSSPGVFLRRGGSRPAPFSPHQLDRSRDLDALLFVEGWQMDVRGSSQDNAITQEQNLIEILRNAWRYHWDPDYETPAYITQQATNETGARYALIWQAPEISNPDFFLVPFEGDNIIEELGIRIARYAWEDGIPGALGSAKVLTASDGPSAPTMVHVANFRDDVNITAVKVDDGGTPGADIKAAAAGTDLFPDESSVAVNDALYFVSTDNAFKHICVGIATAMAGFTGTMVLEFSDGGGVWTGMTLGTDFTLFSDSLGEITSLDEIFTANGLWSINIKPSANWTTDTYDSETVYAIRLRISAFTAMSTVPEKDGSTIYAQRSPYLEIPNTLFKGDAPPILNLRLWTPSGGDENEGFANLSRLILGAKRAPGTFTPFLNLGGQDNPTGWTVTQETDATATADTQSPGGTRSHVDFSSDATMIKRITLTGDGKLGDWIGDYRAILRAEQSGGSAGDCRAKLRIYIHNSNAYSPKFDTEVVAFEGVDQGPELLDLGEIKIPFAKSVSADVFTNADIIFEIHEERLSGAAVLKNHDLILMPTRSWGMEPDDPLSDTVNGTSALRGGNVLDIDGGVLARRSVKYINDGSNLFVAEDWGRGGPPLIIEPESQIRVYPLLGHYPATWGTPPLIGSLGMHAAAEIYGRARYLALRGAN